MKTHENADRRASAVLYDEIITSRNSIRRDNIQMIAKVCDQMEKDRVHISAAEVVRRCGEHGPKYSTVSNKGSQLGDYIRLRISEQSACISANDPKKNLSDSIGDPVLQAQVRDKEQTVRWVKRENAGLRNLLKTLRPGVDIDELLAAKDRPDLLGPKALPVAQPTTDAEVGGALLKLFSHLLGARQYAELRGRLTINGKVVLGVEEYASLRRASGLSEDDWKLWFGGKALAAAE